MHTLTKTPKKQELRSLSQLLSNSTFRKIVREGNTDFYRRRIREYSHLFHNYREKTNANILNDIFKALTQGYRNEYVYKSCLVNQVLLQEYKIDSTTALFEFKISKSVADMLLINGKARLFEIKTELDNPDRLQSQLADYQKAVANITVVTYESLAEKYLKLIQGTDIGLRILTFKNQIIEVRESLDNTEHFEHETLFKMLHKAEYTDIIVTRFGVAPTVPNTRYFNECLSLAKEIEIDVFQKLVFEELKKRKVKEAELIESDLTPDELKTICIALNFDGNEIECLHRFLSRPFSKQLN